MRERLKPEGGSGGKLGRSNMAHWDKTEFLKKALKKIRRRQAKESAQDQWEEGR